MTKQHRLPSKSNSRPLRSALILRLIIITASLGPAVVWTELTSASAQSPDAAKLVNPVPATPASIASGKKLFDSQCVSCHGPGGNGDGKMASQLTPPPANLADAEWKHGSSDGEIYTVVKDGSKGTAMKGFASKMTTQELWSVVNYVKTLAQASKP
jgi:mono/diheme cytochrome c family protein